MVKRTAQFVALFCLCVGLQFLLRFMSAEFPQISIDRLGYLLIHVALLQAKESPGGLLQHDILKTSVASKMIIRNFHRG